MRPRPRSRPELWGQGRGRGQFLDVEAKVEAKDKVMNKVSNAGWQHTGEFISLWSKRHSLFLILSRTVTIFYHSAMSCRDLVGKLKCKHIGPSISSWLQTEARPRPNVWGQGRGRGQSFEAETEVEAKIYFGLEAKVASRPLWPRGLNISVSSMQIRPTEVRLVRLNLGISQYLDRSFCSAFRRAIRSAETSV